MKINLDPESEFKMHGLVTLALCWTVLCSEKSTNSNKYQEKISVKKVKISLFVILRLETYFLQTNTLLQIVSHLQLQLFLQAFLCILIWNHSELMNTIACYRKKKIYFIFLPSFTASSSCLRHFIHVMLKLA